MPDKNIGIVQGILAAAVWQLYQVGYSYDQLVAMLNITKGSIYGLLKLELDNALAKTGQALAIKDAVTTIVTGPRMIDGEVVQINLTRRQQRMLDLFVIHFLKANKAKSFRLSLGIRFCG